MRPRKVHNIDRRRFIQAAGGLLVAGGIAEGLRSSMPLRTGEPPPRPSAAALREGETTTAPPPLPDPPAGALPPAAPADPNANADAVKLLNWFRALRGRDTQRVVSGQQLTPDPLASYTAYVVGLAKQTGKYAAMVGAGYNVLWTAQTAEVLTAHWQAGGLVTMEFHASDPWNPATGVNSAWVKDANAPKPDLRQLLSTAPASAARTQWQSQLQKLGDALEGLATAGVVVILRPFFENNGSWFWWGQDMTTRNTALVALYQDLFHYICGTRGLHNILWVHSPCDSWDGPMMQYYPGSAYVDFVSPTCYDDDLLYLGDRPGQGDHDDYRAALAAGKPMGFGECGPQNTVNGTWDARMIIDRIRSNYTAMSYFDCWSGWDDTVIQLVGDKNAGELMNDPWVITRDTVDWRS